ncbi:MAG TPA: AAA family ATPase [Longimicrobium sp.]|nr:AAA family ATPase [Longimicrobium sp.]
MSSRLADRLGALRRQRFVGREDERTLFRDALSAPDPPFNVLHVCGPGGVGKTTLLREFAAEAARRASPALQLDARDLEPAPDAFCAALAAAMELPPGTPAAEALRARGGRPVILVDTYELLRPLDGWLRGEFLPQLPAQAITVLAGRDQPAPEWRQEWQSLARTLVLGNLEPGDVRSYLDRRGIPAGQHDAVLEATHGHPLALTLVADVLEQRPGQAFHLDSAPDVIRTLLGRFAQKTPTQRHRMALEACALLRLTTESLLAELMGGDDAHELFAWLRELSFVESGPLGLFPHDLARVALSADLRWRNPERYADLHHRARAWYARRLRETHGISQQRVLSDYMYLHRDNPVVKPFIDWAETGTAVPGALSDADRPVLRAMVARHEGEAAARIAEHWFARQPEGVLVVRGAHHEAAGFVHFVRLEEATAEDRHADPAVDAALCWLQENAPLRRGERATFFRFWMAAEEYQAVSATQSLVFLKAAQHYLTTPGLAFTLFPVADAEFWAPFFAYIDLFRVPRADYASGERRMTVFCHDWRTVPPMTWLELLARRELGATGAEPPSAAPEAPGGARVAVLGEAAFAEAVHDALRGYARPRELRRSPLLRTRIVAERAGAAAGEAERAAALQALLREAAEPLRAAPRLRKLWDALHLAYFEPAASQEKAAQRLFVSFSTFRRHLKSAEEQVTEALWRREIGAGAGGAED